MAYQHVDTTIGLLPIASIDNGVTLQGASSAIPTPPLKLGMIVRAVDPTYGAGEFILLPGVSSLAVGSLVTYNLTTYATALAPVGANKPQPIAVSMSANTSSSKYSWFQISGVAVAKKTSGVALASGAACGVLTAGLVAATGTGKEIQGALTGAKSTASTTANLIINRPHMQGRIT